MAAAACCHRFCSAGWQPTIQFIRHGSKSVTRRWKPMNIMRQKLMAVTEYIPPKPLIPVECMKSRGRSVTEENGFAKVLRRQVEQTFRENNMFAVCHYNYAPGSDIVLMRHRLRKYNIHAKFFPNEIVRPFLLESKYKNLLPLFMGRSILLVSPETRAHDMLRVLKSIPQINLLGACVDETILSKEGFTNYAKLPSMVTAQGEVVGALSLLTSRTRTLLQRGPAHLTSLLDQYVMQQSSKEAKEEDDS